MKNKFKNTEMNERTPYQDPLGKHAVIQICFKFFNHVNTPEICPVRTFVSGHP